MNSVVTISDGLAETLQLLLVFKLLYGPTMFFIKASVLLLYRKVFSPNRRMRFFVYIGIGYLLIANGTTTILFGALCTPRNEESYLIRYTSPPCVGKVGNLSIAMAACNLVADLYLLVLPLPTIWKLQLSAKKKYALIGLFTTGFL